MTTGWDSPRLWKPSTFMYTYFALLSTTRVSGSHRGYLKKNQTMILYETPTVYRLTCIVVKRVYLLLKMILLLFCIQIHHEAKVEQEKEKEFVAQAMAGAMKHGGGGRDSRRGSLKPDDWQGGGKGDRDRRDKDRDRDRDRDREREKPKEKLDARKLQVFLKREKTKDSGVSGCTITVYV